MNWTEGNLARHSRGGRGKELLQRQKQHFAKVRSGYFNKHNDPPRSLRDEMRLPADHVGRHRQRHEPPVLNEVDRGQKRARASQTQCRDPPGITTEAEHFHNISSFALSPVHVQGSAAKRLRLLNKRDWTGVEVQKPSQLQFSQREQNVCSPPQSRKEYRRQRPQVPIRHILGERYDALVKGKRLSCGTQPKPDSIRIRVGSQDMRIGGSSVTVRPISEKRDSTASPRHSSRHQTNSGYFRSSSPRESRSGRLRPARSSSERSISINPDGGRAHLCRGVKLGTHSSSPSSGILQPVPCRMHNIILDPLLRSWSPNSDADDSLTAQIGRARPVVLPELQEENNRWVQLMCQSDSGLSTDALRPPKLAGLNVSPGVSADGFRVAALGEPCSETRVCEGEYHDLVTSRASQLCNLQAEESNTPHLSAEATTALSAGPSKSESRRSPEDQATGDPEITEPFNAVRHSPGPKHGSTPASSEKELRETVPPLASEPSADRQRSIVNDRKGEYDAWIKSFLSSEGSDNSFNQKALNDARLDAVQAIQCTRSKKVPSAEDMHEGVICTNPLVGVVSSVRTAASHIATDGSVYSSMEPDSLSLNSTEERREFRPSVNIQANRWVSADNPESDSETHEWKQDRPSFYNTSNCLANESPSVQGTVSHKELDVMSDASMKGNAPASTTHTIQESLIRGPALACNIGSVVAEPAQSTSSQGHSSGFKFATPKLFVGKRATQLVSMTPKPATVATGRGRKGRSRGDKLRRESPGRTSIRHLPNYDGDPIEEFSDEVDLIVCPKSPPLFGALQTE